MSQWVSPVPRSLLIAQLVLLMCVLVEIQTFAIQRSDHLNGRNQNASIISTRKTTHVRASNRISGKREITTPLTFDVDVDTAEDSYQNGEPKENVKPDLFTGEMTTKKPSTIGTTQSNIFSVPTRRPKKSLVMRSSKTASTTLIGVSSAAPGEAFAAVTAYEQSARVDNEDLSMIDLEDSLETKGKPKPRNNSEKIYRNRQITTDQNISMNSKEILTTKYSERESAENYSNSQNGQSHIYKVNSNYKRYKKLNIVAPKPLWRDPNDNSWRNESISSLGIKFTPKINATKAFQLKKKDLSELDTPMPNLNNTTNPGLRERLEKLSEIRKSKKKLNATSSNEILEDDFEYEQESSESPSTMSKSIATSVLTPPPKSLPSPPPPPPPPPAPPLRPPTQSRPPLRRARVKSTTQPPDDKQRIEDKMHKQGHSPKLVFAYSLNNTNTQVLPVNVTENTEHSINKDDSYKENNASKDDEKAIANSNYYQKQYNSRKENQPYSTTAKPKPNQFDYNLDSSVNYEYEDYEMKLSTNVMNDSQTWSDKEELSTLTQLSQTTETSSKPKFTNILDSLTQYLNTDEYSTTEANVQRDTKELDVSRMNKFKILTESGIGLNFTDNIDLPLGPRNKDKINLPQSYSYNTIPHDKMLVRYNTTIIHHTTQESSNIYNKQAGTEPGIWKPVPPSVTNIPTAYPEQYSNSVRMPEYIGGQHLDFSNNDPIFRMSLPEIILQNPVNNSPIVRNVVSLVPIPTNLKHYGPQNEIIHGSILEVIVHDRTENFPIPRSDIGRSANKEPMLDFTNDASIIGHHFNDRSPMISNTVPQINNIGNPQVNHNFSPNRPGSNLQVLYNSTVNHSSMRRPQSSALANVHMKGGYEELAGAMRVAAAAGPSPAVPAAPHVNEQFTHHLPTDYHWHFYDPDQNASRQMPIASNIYRKR